MNFVDDEVGPGIAASHPVPVRLGGRRAPSRSPLNEPPAIGIPHEALQEWPRPRRVSTAGRKPASTSRRRLPAVEVLEAYRLLSTLVVHEFPVATAGARPYEIVAGPDGNLWFSEQYANQIGMVDVKTGAVSEFPDGEPAGTETTGITVGPDGNIWFVSKPDDIDADGPYDIGMINPTTHATAAYPVTATDLGPLNITAGPDGNLWFTQPIESRVGILDPTTGASPRSMTCSPTPTMSPG